MATRKVQPGDVFAPSAADWNAFGRAADAAQASELDQGLPIVDSRNRNQALIRIQNDTGEQIDRYDAVVITEPVISPDDSVTGYLAGLPCFKGTNPGIDLDAIRGRIAICLAPIAAGQIGLAVASGLVRTPIDLQSAAHSHAGPVTGSRRLHSTDDSGQPAEILWAAEVPKPVGEEEPDTIVWALVRLSNWHRVGGLRGACLLEDHPGRGLPFSIRLGTWDPADNVWVYDAGYNTGPAIDWRYGVPYPGAGATGLFEPRASDYYGTIWEVVALDCTSPGECGD